MRALVTGATGFVGRHLLGRLESPAVLTRRPEHYRPTRPGERAFGWDPLAGPPPAEAFEGIDAVFHLAGEPVAEGRWTAAKKQRIRDSRQIGTANLVRGLGQLTQPPRVLVSASAIGYYGSRGDDMLDETAPPADDFLADVCRAWEQASAGAGELGVRVVNPRIGIVLGREGGALAKMLLPFKLGLGGRLAGGRQWMSWIHIDDLVGLLLHAADQQVAGPMNAVAPHPVTNVEFTRALAGALRRPAIFPMPALALKLAVGQFAEVLLASQRVVPQVALRSGYTFRFCDLPPALANLVGA
jgi:uncharacterized protein